MHGLSLKFLCSFGGVPKYTRTIEWTWGRKTCEFQKWNQLEVLRVAHMISKTISYDTHLVKLDQTHSCSHRPMSIHRRISGWWFQSSWKICSSNWIIPPSKGKHRKYLKQPPGPSNYKLVPHEVKSCSIRWVPCWQDPDGRHDKTNGFHQRCSSHVEGDVGC